MSIKKKITVIMPVYKETPQQLRQAIDSILGQTIKNFEFLIVLDNPRNRTAQQIIKEYEKKDKRIRMNINKRNLGLPASLNKAIQLANGELIARMDADDIALPDRLAKELACLKKTGANIVSSNVVYIDEKGKEIKRSAFTQADVQNLRKTLLTKDPHPIVHPTVLGKKKVFLQNPYDETFRNSQDFELWLRLAAKGVRFALVQKPLLKLRVPRTTYEKRVEKNRRYAQYVLRALKKNFPYYKQQYSFYKKFLCTLFRITLLTLPKKILVPLIKLKK
ncbi:glycosyltransferase [Candidatus Pacearchaeota archaeon]|nr:MAG: glycosyltransferase [Candidatus Pacearchaeota archaeon]